MNQLDARISELSEKYLPLAVEMLKEVIRIPADYVDKPLDQGGDPECGLSNHEGPRLESCVTRLLRLAVSVRRMTLDLMSMGIWSGPFPIRMTESRILKNVWCISTDTPIRCAH